MKVLCGPSLSLFCTVLSAWGVLQLIIMGVLFKLEAVALLEDLFIPEKDRETVKKFADAATTAYAKNANNCWIAACIYIVTMLISGQQLYANNRASAKTR